MVHETRQAEHEQTRTILKIPLQRQEGDLKRVGVVMEGQLLADGCDGADMRRSASGFDLAGSMPLQRSQTLELKDRESPDVKKLRRRSSNGVLNEKSGIRKFGRLGEELRLPSFERLGISTRLSRRSPFTHKPNPFQSLQSSTTSSSPRVSPTCTAFLPTSLSAPASSTSHLDPQHLCPTHGFTFPLTPPEEKAAPDFFSQSQERTPTAHSNHNVSASTMSEPTDQIIVASTPGEGPTTSHPEGQLATTQDLGTTLPSSSPDSAESAHMFWLDEAINAVVSSFASTKTYGEAARLLSQTLPCPLSNEIASSTSFVTAFTPVVQAIQSRMQPGDSPYINITHAMPSKFTLSSLPQSPPSTPNLNSGDDYFNMTVFSSATPVPPTHDTHGLLLPSQPSSPAPVVPPSSVNISILERYIPPSSTQEYNDLFSPSGPSVLLDRLFELSPNGGSLLFLLPTKQGALSFKNEYLGQIIDPLLRHLITVYSMSSDVGGQLGRMNAIDKMMDFGALKRKLNTLCRRLNRPGTGNSPITPTTNSSSANSAVSTPAEYTIAHSSTHTVHLPRSLWIDWWITQESGRLRDILNLYWRTAHRLPTDKNVTASILLRELLEGMKMRPYDAEPQEGIEMGVFVIRRAR